jgi:hypothetical protein
MSQGKQERKEPFESKCDSGMCWAYFMAYGVIESISMSTFVEGPLALELPLSKLNIFPTPYSSFYLSSYHICKSPL